MVKINELGMLKTMMMWAHFRLHLSKRMNNTVQLQCQTHEIFIPLILYQHFLFVFVQSEQKTKHRIVTHCKGKGYTLSLIMA